MPRRFYFMKFLCNNFRKKCQLISAVCLHFSKKLKFFSNFVSTRKNSLWMADYGKFSNLCNFHQNFWGRGSQKFWWKFGEFENSPQLAIHNEIFLVPTKFEIFLDIFEKCKQTAEISWHFFPKIVAQKIS